MMFTDLSSTPRCNETVSAKMEKALQSVVCKNEQPLDHENVNAKENLFKLLFFHKNERK